MFKIKSIIKKLFLHIVLLFLPFSIYSQSAVGLKLTGLSFHLEPWEQDYRIFENKITKNGSVILEPGYQISFEKYIYLTVLSLEIRQGIHSDAAAKMAGHVALGLRWKFFHLGRSSLSISASPVYAFRENWNNIPQYIDNDGYINNDKYQYKFLFGSELEYNIFVGKRSDISFSLMYNNSKNTLTLGLGYRFWINPYVKLKEDKCTSCGKRWSQGKFRKWWRRVWR